MDESVMFMNMEQIGCYWTLLVHQMSERDIPEDPELLALILKNMDVEYFKTKIWNRLSDRFKPVEGKPGRLHNIHLTSVMVDGDDRRAKLADAGKKGASVRSLESSLEAYSGVDPTSTASDIDIKPILNAYPKRRNRVGWDFGVKMVEATVTTKEDADKLLAAVRAYASKAKTYSGPDMIKRLDNFMKEWEGWVPATFEEEAQVEKSSAKAEEKEYPANWKRPANAKRNLGYGDRPPWIFGRYDKDDHKATVLARYPDDEAKRRWWTLEDNTTSATSTTTGEIHVGN